MRQYRLIIVAIIIHLIGHKDLADVDAQPVGNAPIVLDEYSWTKLLDGEWMVDFYAPWCPACRKLDPEWSEFAKWSQELNVNVAKADITANPGISGRFMISGLPTIYHVKDGIFRQYSGPRDHNSLVKFIEGRGWMQIEPISKWRSPQSLLMSLLAYAFRISLAMRDVHSYLVDDLGFPFYVSYLLFAFCTVSLGSILGLILVFISDRICPQRSDEETQSSQKRAMEFKKKTDKSSDSDLEDTDNGVEPTQSQSGKVRKRNKN